MLVARITLSRSYCYRGVVALSGKCKGYTVRICGLPPAGGIHEDDGSLAAAGPYGNQRRTVLVLCCGIRDVVQELSQIAGNFFYFADHGAGLAVRHGYLLLCVQILRSVCCYDDIRIVTASH